MNEVGGSSQLRGRLGRWRNAAILLSAAAIFALAWLLWPGLRSWVRDSLSVVGKADIGQLREYLLSFGVWAPVISGLLMVIQAVLFPLPAFVITVANGLVFGAFWGTVLSWSSAMVGAVVCFWITRAMGRPAMEKLVKGSSLAMADRFFDRYGNNAVLIARLIPVVSFDVVSYVAGVTSISFLGFLVATGIGQLPATVAYSVLGENLSQAARIGLYAVVGLAALVVLGLALKKWYERKLFKGS